LRRIEIFSGQTCPKESFYFLKPDPPYAFFLVNNNIRIISNDIEEMCVLLAAINWFYDTLFEAMAQ
jgi:hypothetical protein